MNYYNDLERKELLKIARDNIKYYLENKKKITLDVSSLSEKLKEKRACFVTLHTKKGNELRGCIGQMEAYEELYKAVIDMSYAAAFEDPRFMPLTIRELDEIYIEISVLTPMKKSSYEEIEMGKHGVYIRKGWHSGVFLPQVAHETGWDKDTFLQYLCKHKAGLPAKAYLDSDTEIYTFEVELFSEEH